MHLKWMSFLLLLMGFLILAFTPLQIPDEPISSDASDMQDEIHLTYETGCAETKIRVGYVKLSWEGRMVRPEESNIELTVYPEGFERGYFATFAPLVADPETLPALSSEELVDVQAFQIQLVEVFYAENEEYISGVVIEGLEVNLDYKLRMNTRTEHGWLKSNTVVCQAPVCPGDFGEGGEQ
jgi:hypothetical protein